MENFSVNWLTDDEQAVMLTLQEKSTWQDFDKGVREAHEMIVAKTIVTSLVIKVQDKLPDGNPIMHFSRAARNQPENIGKIIIIVPSMISLEMRLMTRILKIMKKIFPGKQFVSFVGSYEEAVAMVAQSQPTPASA